MTRLIPYLIGCAIGSYILDYSFSKYFTIAINICGFYFVLFITGQLK